MDYPEQLDVIGLLPAGGQATRLSPLPLSKELYPIGFQAIGEDTRLKPKVVSHYLLEKMRLAGIKKAFFILRPGKWDIPAYFGDGAMLNMHLGYLTVHVPHGVPYTLNQAYPFVQRSIVALGFPDILFQPEDAYTHLLAHQATHQVDVVLGLFPTEHYRKAGMVKFDATGRVHQIIEKPLETNLKYMWAIALWTPTFTQFLHEYVQSFAPDRELPIGDVIQAGIEAGLRVEAEVFPEGSFLDVGTPDDLARAIRDLTPDPDHST
ncbi:MAG: dTDP-glucose pyrophosphorylase [Cyanobacteria bacterium RU_5_0]|nr:dTDP-glucose pyrophosphorylase [Cyanobacteria bacterium RU_5_0]